MLLDVSKAFLKHGNGFPFEAEENLLPQTVVGETVTFEKVVLQGTYSVLEETVYLEGTLKTTVCAHCARCLAEMQFPLEIPFKEMFRKDADEGEDEAFQYDGKAVSLESMVLTLVMLHLPMRFLCSEDCQGNEEWQAWQRNNFKSSCEDGLPTQRPFEALQHLLKKDEEV